MPLHELGIKGGPEAVSTKLTLDGVPLRGVRQLILDLETGEAAHAFLHMVVRVEAEIVAETEVTTVPITREQAFWEVGSLQLHAGEELS